MQDSSLVQIGQSIPKSKSNRRQALYIRTYGCQMNEYDTKKLEKILEPNFVKVLDPALADVVIVNTCSIREKAENKLYSMLGEFQELKQINPKMLIGVGGCVAQQEGENIVKRNRAVDFVFGTHNLSLVPSLIERRRSGAEAQVAVNYRDEWEELPLGFVEDRSISAFVSISRGCNKNCTYCIVPLTRGKEVSRDISEIEREVRILVQSGVKEVVLLGQTVNSYGLDFTPRLSFAHLLERVSKIEGLERIRFTSPHPQEVKADFIDLVASNPKICRHIHMPLQSGSDAILKAMNRNYRIKKYLGIIEKLKQVPDMAITTDIIVGFPGESQSDFDATLKIMDRVQFDASYSFVFSARPGTKAALMQEVLSQEEKLERLNILQNKQNEITTQRLAAWVGRNCQVLVEGPSSMDKQRMQGRTSQNFTLNFNRVENIKPGQIVDTYITATGRFTLKGDVC